MYAHACTHAPTDTQTQIHTQDLRLVTHQTPLHAGSLILQNGDKLKSFFFVHWGRYYLYHGSRNKLNTKIIMSRQKSWRLKILLLTCRRAAQEDFSSPSPIVSQLRQNICFPNSLNTMEVFKECGWSPQCCVHCQQEITVVVDVFLHLA